MHGSVDSLYHCYTWNHFKFCTYIFVVNDPSNAVDVPVAFVALLLLYV